jgi:hypothetical protein
MEKMKNRFLTALTVLFLIAAAAPSCSGAAGEQGRFSDLQDVGSWATYYYRSPNLDDIILAIKTIIKDKAFIDDTAHSDSLAHFFAAAFQADKKRIGDLKGMIESVDEKEKGYLRKIIAGAEDFHSPGADDPRDMDFLWAEFMATGKPEPVEKIIGALSATPDRIDISGTYWVERGISSSDMASGMLSGAAEWSLAANAFQHARVNGIIKDDIAKTGDPVLKERLENILKKSDKYLENSPAETPAEGS